ncbi:MAG: hypothetical protein ACRERU_13585 [Methylococcales bacterium]
MNTIEQLKREAEQLSEPLAREVLDFLIFVRARHGSGWPPGLYERTAGLWMGEPLERAPQGDQDPRLDL